MRLSKHQRRAFRRRTRHLIFNLTTGAGALLGLLWAIDQPTPAVPEACGPRTISTDSIGRCMGESLMAALLPYAVAVGLGLLCGAVLGVVLARFLVCEPRDAAKPERAGGARWITARYRGTCAHCTGSVEPGDRVLHARSRTLCAACGG